MLVFMVIAGLVSLGLAGAMGGLGLLGLGKYARRKGLFKDGEMAIPHRIDPKSAKEAAKAEKVAEKARLKPIHDDLTGLVMALGYKKTDAAALATRVLQDGGPQDMQSMVKRAIAAIGKGR